MRTTDRPTATTQAETGDLCHDTRITDILLKSLEAFIKNTHYIKYKFVKKKTVLERILELVSKYNRITVRLYLFLKYFWMRMTDWLGWGQWKR